MCLFAVFVAFLSVAHASPVRLPFRNVAESNDCNVLPSGTAGSYKQCGGQNWKGPTVCCCDDQKCSGDQNYKQCTPHSNASVVNSIGQMTHYWDCCKPSCAWPGGQGLLVKSCDSTGATKSDPNAKSVCDDSSGSATCKDQMPWIEDGILYGFGAVAGDPKTSDICGKCYELEFSNARSITKAQVMVTNGGDSAPGNVDFLVPGGGFGQFNGCSSYGGWSVYTPQGPCSPGSDSPECAQYGGFKGEKYCDSAFPGDLTAAKACHDILFSVFPQIGCNHDAGYPPNLEITSKTEIPCPPALSSKA